MMAKQMGKRAGGTDAQKLIPFAERLTCSIAEACCAAGVGRTKLYELIDEGAIQTTKIGRRRLVRVPSLVRLLGRTQHQ